MPSRGASAEAARDSLLPVTEEESPPTLVLYEPRGPQMWQPGCAAIGTLISLAAIIGGQLGGIALVLLFGAFLALSVYWYRARPDRLTLDADGFTFAHGALDRRVLWRDLEGIDVVPGRRPWIHLRFASTAQSYPFYKALPGSTRRTAPTLPSTYGMTADALASTLREWRSRAPAPSPDHESTETRAPGIGRYEVREDGNDFELVRAGPGRSCVVLFIGFWIVCWDLITVGMTLSNLGHIDPGAILAALMIWTVAIVGTYMALRAVLLRRSWLLSGGVVTERLVILGVGEVARRTYEPIDRIEIATGLWETGAGRTDSLAVWVHGRAKPLVIEKDVENDGARIQALGDLIARRTARPLVKTETRVPEPPAPD